MKLITEELRQALIVICENGIEGFNTDLTQDSTESPHKTVIHRMIYELALASLTTEPIGKAEWSTGYQMGIIPTLNAGVELLEGQKIYTAPPVPVIKLQSVLRAMKKSDEASDLYPSQILIIAEDIIKYLNASGE